MHLAPSLQAVPCRLCRFTATSRDHHFFLRPFQISGLPALDPRSVTFVLESTTVVYRLLTNRGAPSRPPLVYFFNDVLSVRPVRTRRTCRSRVVLDRKNVFASAELGRLSSRPFAIIRTASRHGRPIIKTNMHAGTWMFCRATVYYQPTILRCIYTSSQPFHAHTARRRPISTLPALFPKNPWTLTTKIREKSSPFKPMLPPHNLRSSISSMP